MPSLGKPSNNLQDRAKYSLPGNFPYLAAFLGHISQAAWHQGTLYAPQLLSRPPALPVVENPKVKAHILNVDENTVKTVSEPKAAPQWSTFQVEVEPENLGF